MYYVAVNRVQRGPLSETEVHAQIADKEIHAEDLCWREGWEKWRRISDVFPPAEPPVLTGAPPPIPRVPQPAPVPYAPAGAATSGLAIASLICGACVFVLFPLFFLMAPAAVVCGHLAKASIGKSEGKQTGSGLATAGLLLGYIGGGLLLAIVTTGTAIGLHVARRAAQEESVLNNLVQIWSAAEQQMLETGAEVVTYDQLVGPGKPLQESSLKPIAGEDYHGITVHHDDPSLSVTLGDGRTVEYYHATPVVEPADYAEPSEDNPPEEAPESLPADSPAPANEPATTNPATPAT